MAKFQQNWAKKWAEPYKKRTETPVRVGVVLPLPRQTSSSWQVQCGCANLSLDLHPCQGVLLYAISGAANPVWL